MPANKVLEDVRTDDDLTRDDAEILRHRPPSMLVVVLTIIASSSYEIPSAAL
jgi:hypothetical protein